MMITQTQESDLAVDRCSTPLQQNSIAAASNVVKQLHNHSESLSSHGFTPIQSAQPCQSSDVHLSVPGRCQEIVKQNDLSDKNHKLFKKIKSDRTTKSQRLNRAQKCFTFLISPFQLLPHSDVYSRMIFYFNNFLLSKDG